MKVCMLYHHTLKILEKDSRVLKEANSLQTHGHDVTILCLDFFKEKHVNAFGTQIRCIGYPRRKRKGMLNILRKMGRTTKEKFPVSFIWPLFKIRPDAIHVHDYDPLLAGVVAGRLLRVPVIYDAHEYLVDRWDQAGAPEKKRKLTKKIEHRLLRHVYASITVNDSLAMMMEKNQNTKRPIVVSNFPHFTKTGKSKLIKTKLKIDVGQKIILFQGVMIKGRGLYNLVKAAALLPQVHFVMMGDGHLKQDLMRIVENEKLKNVSFIEPVPPNELMAWTSSADIGISPIQNTCLSYYYSLPNKVGEAIMAGLPIAVSDFPEMRKLAVDDDMGVVFDSESPEDITRALKELLEPETYARKKKNVMEKRKKYCWENEEKILLALYKEVRKSRN